MDFLQSNLPYLLAGVSTGGQYALIAIGYTMVYGILRLINFAHGDVFMAAGLIMIYSYSILPLWLAVIFTVVLTVLLGFSVERIAYKPLRKGSRLAPLLSAIGVSFILSNGAAWMFGTHSRKFNYPFDNSPIDIGGVVITPHQILILVVAIVMMVALKIFVDKTKMGKAMRATSLDGETAKLMGINSDMIISLTFGIGSALAACGGILISLDYKVYATMGTMVGLKAFVAAVVGGIGNITGAMLGGFLLGLLETFGVAVLGIPQGFKDAIAFAVLILILLLKPEGLLGKVEKEKV